MINLRVLQLENYPGISRWAQCKLKGLYRSKAGGWGQAERCRSRGRGWSEVPRRWKGPGAQGCLWPLGAREARERLSEPAERAVAAGSWRWGEVKAKARTKAKK